MRSGARGPEAGEYLHGKPRWAPTDRQQRSRIWCPLQIEAPSKSRLPPERSVLDTTVLVQRGDCTRPNRPSTHVQVPRQKTLRPPETEIHSAELTAHATKNKADTRPSPQSQNPRAVIPPPIAHLQ